VKKETIKINVEKGESNSGHLKMAIAKQQ